MIPDSSSFLHLNSLSILTLFCPEGPGGNLTSRDHGIEEEGGKTVKDPQPCSALSVSQLSEATLRKWRDFLLVKSEVLIVVSLFLTRLGKVCEM